MDSVLHLLRTGWEFAVGQRARLAAYVVLSAAALGASLSEPFIIGHLLDAAQGALSGSGPGRAIALWLAAYVGANLLFWCLHGPSRVMEREVAFSIRTHFELALFRTVIGLPLQWHRDHHSGETIAKIQRASAALGAFWEGSFELIQILSRFAGAFVILSLFMPSAGVVAGAATMAAVLGIRALDRHIIQLNQQLNRLLDRAAAAVHDYVTNATTVVTLRVQRGVSDEVEARRDAAFPVARRAMVANELKWFGATLLTTVVIAGLFGWYVSSQLAAHTALKIGTLYTFFEYLRRMGDSCYGLAFKYGAVIKQGIDLRDADAIRALARQAGPDPIESRLRSSAFARLRVEQLDFTYEDDQHRPHHLCDIALDLEPGKSIALIGSSGSGKSTLLRVLRGLHAPSRVHVLRDGILDDLGLSAISERATLIPQEPELFSDTIRFNIGFGLDVDEREIREAMATARFEPVLARLPNGLATNIAEKGVNLSGGERQRLALARGVLFAERSEIVLLDEPTSSVDPHNEQLIYVQLLSRFRDRAVVCALHRLHLLPLFDRVVVMDDGRIVEQGTFADLVQRRDGPFARLWRSYGGHGEHGAGGGERTSDVPVFED